MLKEQTKQADVYPVEVFQLAIVDRDSMSSDLLATALGQDGRCRAQALRSADLLKTLAVAKLHLLVIAAEISHSGRNGFDLASSITRAYPSIYVVVLINQSSRDSVVNAFRCGARGVISREQSTAELIECVHHVRKGLMWAGAQETSILLEAFQSLPAPSPVMAADSPALSVRELQVVQHAAKGKTNKAIAGDLGLSEHTVKNYLFRAFEKLGVSSRVELLFYLTLRGYSFSSTPVILTPQLEEKNA